MSSTTAGYSPEEERLNVWTHAAGFFLSIPAAIVLGIQGWQGWIFGLAMALLFLASTLYHSAKPGMRRRAQLKKLDHMAIFVLIAGTYTPFATALPGDQATHLLLLIWGIALAGIIFKWFFTGRFKLISTLLYVGMGWIAVGYAPPFSKVLSAEVIQWVLIGGLAYTIGALLYMVKRLPFNHALFHVFVLMGAAAHFIAVLRFL